jgi:excisionase family DNA binding protein
MVKRRLVTTAKAALMLGVSVYTVRRLVKRGKLIPICLGEQGEGHYRFDTGDVERLIASSRRIRWR